jgi:hypothetical protein
VEESLPNFIHGAIYRTKGGIPHSSASNSRFNCFTLASKTTPPGAYVADCWVCDAFGRVDPGLSVSPIPVRKEDLGKIINTLGHSQGI